MRLVALIWMVSVSCAVAQGTSVPFSGLQHDTSLPVEITADALDLNQTAGTALFQGNVIAGQGPLRLAAPKVEVTYTEGGGEIDFIEASGGVTLTNGVEAAEAQSAVYQVAKGEVLMEGDVLLTQGPNALAGETLRINLDSGLATMEGRVRTILQPNSTQGTSQ
ncbi:MAG: LptA/OstA family protein [Pseudomonadota bacterium]